MLTLCIRTDKPAAELYLYEGDVRIAEVTWEAHRKLADTIHIQLRDLLEKVERNFADIAKIVVYKGPGSFTGLRIGVTVANTLAYGLSVPIVGVSGDDWQDQGISDSGSTDPIQPLYGRDPHITQQKK